MIAPHNSFINEYLLNTPIFGQLQNNEYRYATKACYKDVIVTVIFRI